MLSGTELFYRCNPDVQFLACEDVCKHIFIEFLHVNADVEYPLKHLPEKIPEIEGRRFEDQLLLQNCEFKICIKIGNFPLIPVVMVRKIEKRVKSEKTVVRVIRIKPGVGEMGHIKVDDPPFFHHAVAISQKELKVVQMLDEMGAVDFVNRIIRQK